MPKAELEVEDVELEEDLDVEVDLEVNEDEDDDVVEETTTTTTKKKKKRKTFADSNVYVYSDAKEARNAIREKKFTYTDGTEVEGMRVFEVCKGGTVDDDGKRTGHDVVGVVVNKTPGQAAVCYLESKGINLDLAFRKKAVGRAKTKIDAMILMYGKLLQANIMESGTFTLKADADPGVVAQWNNGFAVGATNAHYIDWTNPDSPCWKEPTE